MTSESRPLYRPLACWFCLPSFAFLLAPVLEQLGETGTGLAILTVLMSAWVAPIFAVFAFAIAMFGHFVCKQAGRERFMWVLLTVAVAANLIVIFTGGGARFLANL